MTRPWSMWSWGSEGCRCQQQDTAEMRTTYGTLIGDEAGVESPATEHEGTLGKQAIDVLHVDALVFADAAGRVRRRV